MTLLRAALRTLLARIGLLETARRLRGRGTYAHGHALLLALLPKGGASGAGGFLLEVGTTRERLDGQGSTIELANAAQRMNLQFVTIDMDPANSEQARLEMANLPNATAVTAKGEDYLATFRGPVVAAYLDAFDIDHGQHSEYRKNRYREFLGTEITNDASQQMHHACAEALVPNVVDGGLIVFDDTFREGDQFGGKGASAVPMLLGRGFRIAGHTPTAIALEKVHLPDR